MKPWKTWGNWRGRHAWVASAILTVALLVGCGEAVKLVPRTASTGIVSYPYNTGQGHMASSFRGNALREVELHCGGTYSIVREGQVKSWKRTVKTIAGTEVVSQPRWGIEFRCQDRSAAPVR